MFVVDYIPIKSYNIIFETSNLDSEEFKKRYKTIISGLKTKGPFWYQFIWVFFFRWALYASTFVIFSTNPLAQIIFTSLTVVGMLGYLILVRPYNTLLSSILSITNELFLAVMIFSWSRFVNPKISPGQSKQIGMMFVGKLLLR